MKTWTNVVLAMAFFGLCCGACADAGVEDRRTTPTEQDEPTNSEPADNDSDSDSQETPDSVSDTTPEPDTQDSNDSVSDEETDEPTSDGTDCSADKGVYNYCNNSTPCSCDNLCGKAIMSASAMIKYKPISSICLAECTMGQPNACPHAWEECGKMKDSDPQAFCMPMGKVSGTWQARVFEQTIDLSEDGTVQEDYLMNNDDITVDVGWWQPAPTFTKGIVALGDPAGTGDKYYTLTLVPETKIEHGNTIDNWLFEVLIPEDNWKASNLSLSGNSSAFLVQPMLLRIVTPTVSMRTWVHGAVRTSSTFTIDDPGALCTNLANVENCAIASGSFDIDLFGLSGTIEEE